MNGLRDMLYSGYASPATASAPASGGGAGASFGFNVGDETFRLQIAITALLGLAVLGLVLLHRGGNRFSVRV